MSSFRHGLFGCFDNCGTCILSYFCPCYVVGKTAEAVGESCCLCGVGWVFTGCIVGGIVRGKVRAQHNIEGSALGDFCVHWFCALCAIAQDHQEIMDNQSIARV